MKFALRQLLKSPGFTFIVILTLALGIGANTAIFSVINAVLLRPLPYDEPRRLMAIWESSTKQNFAKGTLPAGDFFDLQAQNRSFSALAAWAPASLALTGDTMDAVRLDAAFVTAELTTVLRASPRLGRFFTPEEFSPGRDNVVLLSFPLWQQRFGGDPAVIGRTVRLNGRSCTVVGVMPEHFDYPKAGLAWVPFAPTAEEKQDRGFHHLRVIGRLQDGITYDQARTDLARINHQLAEQYPKTNADWSVVAYPMLEDAVSKIRPTLMILVAAVGAVLLIACSNVTNLLLARAASRRQEIAIRVSLGATRGQIVRQLLSEYLLLFALGGCAGVLLAKWSLGALLSLAPHDIPRVDRVTIDTSVLAFTSLVALGTGLVFGLIPAWQSAPGDLHAAMRQRGRGATAGRSRLRSALVVLQVAGAVVLLVTAGLLIRSFDQVRRVSLGFVPEHVLTFHLDLAEGRYPDGARRERFLRSIADALAALPGVQAAGVTTSVPMDGGPTLPFRIEGRPPVAASKAPVTRHRVVSQDYFQAIGMTLLRGRGFTAADAPGSQQVCVINQTLARQQFPNEDPIGKRLAISTDGPPDWRVIVGLVADVKMDGLDAVTPPQVFEPVHQFDNNHFTFAVRVAGDPRQLVPSVRAAVQALDPTQPIFSLEPMTQIIDESLGQRTFSLVLLTAFAGVALALASVGLYGVLSFNVAQRTREFGVRMALGASSREILRLVLRSGSRLIALGIVLGLGGAELATHLVRSFLFGIGDHDLVTYAFVGVILAGVALVAMWLPARRATKVEPVVALRAE